MPSHWDLGSSVFLLGSSDSSDSFSPILTRTPYRVLTLYELRRLFSPVGFLMSVTGKMYFPFHCFYGFCFKSFSLLSFFFHFPFLPFLTLVDVFPNQIFSACNKDHYVASNIFVLLLLNGYSKFYNF